MVHDREMRIVSLLPSATEIVYLLGLGDDLVGVTHECDWPPAAMNKPKLTKSRIPSGSSLAEIDDLVSASAAKGESTSVLSVAALAALEPDLVLTQDVCAVCALPAAHIRAELENLSPRTKVLSLDPSSIEDVLEDIKRVGQATGKAARSEDVVASLQARLDRVRDVLGESPAGGSTGLQAGDLVKSRPGVLALEWGDPLYNAGHWVPEMIERAGGNALLSAIGMPSVKITWENVVEANADVIVYMPCGYQLKEALGQARVLAERPEIQKAGAFFAASANDYFSRPGPRLVDGVEALAFALNPGCGIDHPDDAIAQVF